MIGKTIKTKESSVVILVNLKSSHLCKWKKNTTITVSVLPELYLKIKSEKERILIDHKCCKIFDDLNIKPYIKCGKFGHNPKKCTNEVVCLLVLWTIQVQSDPKIKTIVLIIVT